MEQRAVSADIDREAMVRSAMPLVGHCVASVATRLPRHVRHDDLVSAGLFGLAQAARAWDPQYGVSFEHFARRRINGAILDELRSLDWASRSARRGVRRLQAATEQLTARLGRAPETAELAAALDVSHDDVERMRGDHGRSAVLHLESLEPSSARSHALVSGPGTDPGDRLLGEELHAYLRDAVQTLPERLRTVVVGYFFEERPMKDIAAELGVTVSRVSQLRARAVRLLRDHVNAQFDEPDDDEGARGEADRRAAPRAIAR